MRKLAEPIDDALTVYRLCTSRVRRRDLRARLNGIEADIIAAANDYRARCLTSELNLVASATTVGAVTREELEAVYDSRMARSDGPGRPVYDRLLAAPELGRCPLCGQRDVSTLDHHLPKNLYPGLAVLPVNLVPACATCNFIKKAHAPTQADLQTYHPYFDDVEATGWLHAEVHEVRPAALRFRAHPEPHVPPALADKVRFHFLKLELGKLYASHAAEEMLNIRHSLVMLEAAGGMNSVRARLIEQRDTYRARRLNSWQTAMYAALAASDWFCLGGFRP